MNNPYEGFSGAPQEELFPPPKPRKPRMSKKSFTMLTLAVRVVQPPNYTQQAVIAEIKAHLAEGAFRSFAQSTTVKIIGKETTYL
jgi:hypothetical protein